MPSGITGRDGFLPALVKSIRRSFPCRHPTTGGSLKGSPAGTPLTHRFLYYPYSTTAAAVCQPSFCPGPQPAGRRDGPSGEFARNVGLSNRVGLCVLVGVAVGPPGLAGPYHSGALLLRTSLGKTAILHLCFGTEKNRRLGSKKARYSRAFRRRHLFCLHIMVEQGCSRMNTPPKLRFRFQMPFLYHPAGYCQCSTASCWR